MIQRQWQENFSYLFLIFCSWVDHAGLKLKKYTVSGLLFEDSVKPYNIFILRIVFNCFTHVGRDVELALQPAASAVRRGN